MSSIIQLSLRQRMLIIILAGLLVAVGIDSLYRLPMGAVPDLTNTQVQILTQSKGLAPEEVERLITFPIEQAMSGIPRLEKVRSLSQFGLSSITVVFKEGTDIHWARQQISQRLALARAEIPSGYGTPSMGPLSTGLGEILQFEVKSQRHTPMQLRTMLDWYIVPPLRTVQGVVEVNSFGGFLLTYEVQINVQRLLMYNLTLHDVSHALKANNANVGGGYIAKSGEQYIIRGEGMLRNPKHIGLIPVKTRKDGTPILIRQLGKVRPAPMVRQGAVTRDGRGEAVTGIVMLLQGENARFVIQRIHKRLKQIQQGLPEGVTLDVFYDRSRLIHRTLGTVQTNLWEGGLLVIIVLFLLLGNLRGGLLVALSIPLSLLFAFICMRWVGISGNLMSLGAIDFGIIVDGSVVMVEHIIFALGTRKLANADSFEAVSVSAREVSRPIVFAVAIITIVYLPILTLQGTEGKLFKPMAWTVIFALLGSLLLTLTLVPVLAGFLFRKGAVDKETFLTRAMRRLYKPALRWALRYRYTITVVAAVLFLGSLVLLFRMGSVFIPRLDEGALAIQASRLPSVSLEESIRHTTRMEKVLKSFPEVKSVISKTGRPEIATDPMGVYLTDIIITLHPRSSWRSGWDTQRLVNAMKVKMEANVPGNNYAFSQPIELRTAELVAGVSSDVAVKIFGDDMDKLRATANAIAKVARRVRGAADVVVETTAGQPYLRARLNRMAMGRYGISAETVLHAIEVIGGKTVSFLFQGDKRFALRVRYRPEDRVNLNTLQNIPVRGANGVTVKLGQLAYLWVENGPVQIQREQARRFITVEVNVRGQALSTFVNDLKSQIGIAIQKKRVKLPTGYFLEWGGQYENLERASKRLLIVVPLALLLIFLLLQMNFGSVRLSAMIYLNIPMAATGGILALQLRGLPLSISAGIGFIALFGIAVMNGVVLVSAIQAREQEGHTVVAAVWYGAMERLRPVLMTALTDAIGFLPMAISTTAGAEVQRPLATVVIGGVFTSTFLTLFVLPAMYTYWGHRTTIDPEELFALDSDSASSEA